MFKVRVIPCLDVKDGRVVKGINFVDLRDAGDPVEAAVAYDAAGADELTFLDITATHENRGIMLDGRDIIPCRDRYFGTPDAGLQGRFPARQDRRIRH